MDKNPKALAFAGSFGGAVLLHLLFVLLLTRSWISQTAVVLSALALCLCLFFPGRRIQLVGGMGILSILAQPFRYYPFPGLSERLFAAVGIGGIDPAWLIAGVAGAFAFAAWIALSLQARFRGNMIGRYPIAAQLFALAGLVGLAAYGNSSSLFTAMLWTFIGVFLSNFWLLGYAFANLKMKEPASANLHAGYLRPFWGGDFAPVGKGIAFLRKFEAKNRQELAATRLKALKLLVWGLILQRIHFHLESFVERGLGLPNIEDAMIGLVGGHAVAPHTGWMILLTHFFLHVISLAAVGHIIVAQVRMAGFAIPRNTARPLASRTIGEFWNRYYYYFKEILVDFFFFPAFTRFFKKNPKIRIAFATFCAAAIGNAIYHFILLTPLLTEMRFSVLIYYFQSYIIYVTVLAVGIIISQLRNSRPKPEDGFLRYQILPRVNVTLFFCVLMIFDGFNPNIGIGMRFSFLFSLIGV
jgi:hypothetical protein